MPANKPDFSPAVIDLQLWLDEFPIEAEALGQQLFLAGRVEDLSYDSPNNPTSASAVVKAPRRYECTLYCESGSQWDGDCNCPLEFNCPHICATVVALHVALTGTMPARGGAGTQARPARPAGAGSPLPSVPPDEQALVDEFVRRTGAKPTNKELTFLRSLLNLHRGLGRGSYPHYQVLFELVPPAYRHTLPYYRDPFLDRWSEPPATALELWSHVALIFSEYEIPPPAFMALLTDLDAAQRTVTAHRREKEIVAWRQRFESLETSTSTGAAATAVLRTLRLRLGRKKPVWEISAAGGDPLAGTRFQPMPANEMRELVERPDRVAATLDPASTAVAAFVRAHRLQTGRTSPRLNEHEDRALIGQLLRHPHARSCVVDDAGRAIEHDPRRLIWRFKDHPADAEVALAELAFSDGTPAPAPLVHLPGVPDLYLHGATLFTGLPPPSLTANANPSAPVAVPRAALALPEAARFAARVAIRLPGDATGRLRHELLRARVRASLSPRRPDGPSANDRVLIVELSAVNPEGTTRAIFNDTGWRRSGRGVAVAKDAAFLVLDFEPLAAAVEQFGRLMTYRDDWHPEGPRVHAEIRAGFTETFAAWLAGFPPDTRFELDPELAAFAQPPTRGYLALEIAESDQGSGIDWFDVRVALRAEDTTLTPEELALLRKAKGRFVELSGRGWRRLELTTSPVTDERLADLGLDANTAMSETAREPMRFHAMQLADETLREALPERLWKEVRDRAAAIRKPEPPPLPAGLVAELRPYQREGFHFLAFLSENRFGGVLADDMGLGKTLQALAWFLWLAARPERKGPWRALVVCPKSVVVNWQLETARFAPGLTTATLAARESGNRIPAGVNLVVANYTQLRLHADALAEETWDAVVLDEGQNIKNPVSATAKAARALKTAHRLVLTGTPIENRLLDLWSLFAFAMPGLLGGQTAFKRLYNDRQDSAGARTRLAHRVRHFLLRRTKTQVARDLPPRIEEDLLCELEGSQRALYDAELKRARQMLLAVKTAREFDTQRFNILQSLLRLRQICCDPRLVGAGGSALGGETGTGAPPSAKLEALFDTLEPLVAEGHKVLVFSQFVTMLELIRGGLKERGIAHLMLTGQTENRQDMVDKFQADPALHVFLLSLKAAGSGLNLTAASYVVLYDPWWNPAVEAQAIDRTHRIGQRNQVIAYRLLARGTIEEKIRALQRDKAALAAAVVQEESLAKVLDLESLRQILA